MTLTNWPGVASYFNKRKNSEDSSVATEKKESHVRTNSQGSDISQGQGEVIGPVAADNGSALSQIPVAPSRQLDVEKGQHINFKSMNWLHCGIIMIAETISLGILSLPEVLNTVGLIPGLILIIGLGAFATYSGYVIYQFKLRYPDVHDMADAFEILFTPLGWPKFGRELGGAGQTLFLVFCMASHILTWVICFNTLTNNSVCNVVWGAIALIVFWVCDIPRTLQKMSYMSVICEFSVF